MEVLQSQDRLHRVPRRILHMVRANCQQFWKHAICPNWPYYSKLIFMDQFMEFVRFKRKGVLDIYEVDKFEYIIKI